MRFNNRNRDMAYFPLIDIIIVLKGNHFHFLLNGGKYLLINIILCKCMYFDIKFIRLDQKSFRFVSRP